MQLNYWYKNYLLVIDRKDGSYTAYFAKNNKLLCGIMTTDEKTLAKFIEEKSRGIE